MIKNTFCHIYGIGEKTEKYLWDNGIFSWGHIEKLNNVPLANKLKKLIYEYIPLSIEAYKNDEIHFFSKNLPTNQLWRIFPDFRKHTAYLDIETTGLYFPSHITTIALYDGKNIFTYIKGENLSHFKKDIKKYKVIVTYNGKCFDVPFLENELKIKIDHIHIDLRYILKSLGYSGGLKGCERSIGIDRGILKDVNGFFAVLLWKEYKRTRNDKYLETLLSYNVEDVVNLEKIMVKAYNMKINTMSMIKLNKIKEENNIVNPFNPDQEIINEIQKNLYQSYYMRFGF